MGKIMKGKKGVKGVGSGGDDKGKKGGKGVGSGGDDKGKK